MPNSQNIKIARETLNIGFEIDGKKHEHLRPVVIFKKLSNQTALVIPLTSKLKDGSWYSPSFVNNQEGRFCLNQIRMIDAKRLSYRIERLGEPDFNKLLDDFNNFIQK